MGCNPSKSERNLISPVSVLIQPTESAPISDYPSYHRPSSRKNTKKKVSRVGRGLTMNPNPRRYSVSPVEVNDFWGTMPLSVIIERFNLYKEEVERSGGNFEECIEYIQNILNDLSENFETSVNRSLKKSNSKFKQFIGKYTKGVLFIKSLGFRENGEFLKIDDGLTKVNMKHKVREFEISLKKARGNSIKCSTGTQ